MHKCTHAIVFVVDTIALDFQTIAYGRNVVRPEEVTVTAIHHYMVTDQ